MVDLDAEFLQLAAYFLCIIWVFAIDLMNWFQMLYSSGLIFQIVQILCYLTSAKHLH